MDIIYGIGKYVLLTTATSFASQLTSNYITDNLKSIIRTTILQYNSSIGGQFVCYVVCSSSANLVTYYVLYNGTQIATRITYNLYDVINRQIKTPPIIEDIDLKDYHRGIKQILDDDAEQTTVQPPDDNAVQTNLKHECEEFEDFVLVPEP